MAEASQLSCYNCAEILLQETYLYACRVCKNTLLCSDCINSVPLHDSGFPDLNPPDGCFHQVINFDKFLLKTHHICEK